MFSLASQQKSQKRRPTWRKKEILYVDDFQILYSIAENAHGTPTGPIQFVWQTQGNYIASIGYLFLLLCLLFIYLETITR
jgi:hypothetical protein